MKITQIEPSSILIYYESEYNFKRFDNTINAFDFFKKKGFKQVKQWNWKNNNKTNLFDDCFKDIKTLKPNNEIDKWVLKSIKEMCAKVEYWTSFF